MPNYKGSISPAEVLIGQLIEQKNIQGIVAIGNRVEVEHDEYDGSYIVIPQIDKQILDTSNKVMRTDLVIEQIPYAEVTNLANGTTVTIGGN